VNKIFKWRAKLQLGDQVKVLLAHKDRDYVPGRNIYTGKIGAVIRIIGRRSNQLITVFFLSGDYFWFEPDELEKQTTVKSEHSKKLRDTLLDPGPKVWPRDRFCISESGCGGCPSCKNDECSKCSPPAQFVGIAGIALHVKGKEHNETI